MYQEELFWLFPVATNVIGTVAFLILATPWTVLAYIDPPSLRKYKIQQKPFNVKKWLWPSLWHLLRNSLLAFVLTGISWPLLRLSGVHAGPLDPWYIIVLSIIFFIFLDDFLYYFMHKAFHTKWLYKKVHSVHHRPTNPVAIAGNYLHPVEYVATISLLLIGPLLLGSHVVTIYIWIIFRQLEATDGHCGYDIPWSPANFIPFYHGPAYHDFHHKVFTGNYAGFLPHMDKFFYGYAKGFLDYEKGKARNLWQYFQKYILKRQKTP